MSKLNEQQQQAVAAIDNNVHVAAGAGTGKTTTLTERYFHILETNLDNPAFGLENILAITFTRAAAQEMRLRIRKKLDEKRESLNGENKGMSDRLGDLLRHFDQAQIMTIDSLQGKILRENPVEAGINPDYQVMEELDYRIEIETLTQTFLRTHLEDEDLLTLLESYDLAAIRKNLTVLYAKDKPQLEIIPLEILLKGEQTEGEIKRGKHWLNLYRKMAEFLQVRKDNQDLVSFGDVARRAVNLLKNNKEVRHFYQQQYRYIMVDEFQDTNAFQQELVYLLCGDNPDETGTLAGKKLFIVGDEKQSIYRFRGAEVEVFHNVCHEMDEKGGSHFELVENHRSTRQVIDFVNRIFGDEGLKMPNYIPLQYPEKNKEQQGPLPIIKIYSHSRDKNVKMELPIESAGVAEYIEGLLKNKTQTLEGKPLLPKDIAILVKVGTNIGYLTAALQDRKINYVVLGGRGFYETQEVMDILNIFRVLLDPMDNIAFLGTARSIYGGCNDQELTDLCRDNRDKSLLMALIGGEKTYSGNLERLGRLLAKLREQVLYLPVVELWQQVLRGFNVEYTLLYQEQGEQKWANVLKLETLCWNYCNSHSCGIKEWLEFAEKATADNKETSADLSATSAVQIMSIHKSKGLEYNTVILPFLHKMKSKSDNLKVLYNVEEQEFASKLDGKKEYYETLETQENAAEAKERMRLFYVALTRAKERLYLSGWQKEDTEPAGDKSFLAMAKYGMDLTDPNPPGGKTSGQRETVPEGKNNLEVQRVTTAALALPQPVYFTPSRLQTYGHCQRRYFYQYGCGLPPYQPEQEHHGEEAGLTPAETGTLLHKALEYYHGDKDGAFNKAVLSCNFPEEKTERAKITFINYVDSDLFKKIPGEHEREVAFQLPLDDGVIFGGVIDCLYKKADGTYGIVDYKTGRVPEALNKGYAMQLAIYGEAVRKMYKGEVSELQLHYLQTCEQFSLTGEADTYREALNIAKEIQSKKSEEEFEPNPDNCKYCEYAYLCKEAK